VTSSNSVIENVSQSVPEFKKNFKIRSIFGKDMDKSLMARVLAHGVYFIL